jgi:hypothetical protein
MLGQPLYTPMFGTFYYLTTFWLTVFLAFAVLALFIMPRRPAALLAEIVWFASILDVLFELTLIGIAALVALLAGDGLEVWAETGKRELIIVLCLYVYLIALLRRKADRWIDDGPGGGGGGGDDDDGGGPGRQVQQMKLAPRGPMTALSSRAPLVRALRHLREGGNRPPEGPATASDAGVPVRA